jgi:hypothetical protein
MKTLVWLVCLFGMIAADAAPICGPKNARPRLGKPTVITLTGTERGARAAPAFYVRRPEHLVIFLKPDDVLEALREQEAKYVENRNDGPAKLVRAFADAVAADLPLKEDTDLLKYSFRSTNLGFQADGVVDWLLERGWVSVGDWGFFGNALNSDLDDMKTILRASQRDSMDELARWYCTSYGAPLFSAVYIMY